MIESPESRDKVGEEGLRGKACHEVGRLADIRGFGWLGDNGGGRGDRTGDSNPT